MFADPHTNLIKVEKLHQLLIDNRITISFEKFQQLIAESNKSQIDYLSFQELQDISNNQNVNQSKISFLNTFRFQKHYEKAQTSKVVNGRLLILSLAFRLLFITFYFKLTIAKRYDCLSA